LFPKHKKRATKHSLSLFESLTHLLFQHKNDDTASFVGELASIVAAATTATSAAASSAMAECEQRGIWPALYVVRGIALVTSFGFSFVLLLEAVRVLL
jgi:hypothetical protein